MAEKFVSKRNIQFMLDEVFAIQSLTQYPYYEDHTQDTFNMIVDTAYKIAANLMFPYFKDLDRESPEWVDGVVKVHPIVKQFLQEIGQGGWIQAEKPYEVGGQQIPVTIKQMVNYIFGTANYSLSAYIGLTAGAANLIYTFGSEEMKNTYLEKMYAGIWQGTMALTEPDVGSSLGDLATQAEETGDGYYKIKGTKIFISAGNHDAVENVVHLMLARIKGAPAGVKGISLFVVPQYRINEQGELEYNDVSCGGIEHKLGYRGCPICQLNMGENKDCRGYLVGKPNQGLGYMFQMMNEARVDVGLGAVAKATAAYYASLEYAQQRLQGRRLTEKDPAAPMIAIINHPDIKRMLLYQRAIVEGALSLVIQASYYEDLAKMGIEPERNELLIDFLVPIIKTYPAEMGILSTSAAIQIHGGYGFCGDFPVEQYYRDIRIDTLHEGTTCMQGQDILGRKVTMKQGKAFGYFQNEIEKTIYKASNFDELIDMSYALQSAVQCLNRVTANLLGLASQGKTDEFLADSVLYLELISIIAIAWQWLKQAVTAAAALISQSSEHDINFYRGKIFTCQYFFDYELPKIEGLAIRLTAGSKITVDMPIACFED